MRNVHFQVAVFFWDQPQNEAHKQKKDLELTGIAIKIAEILFILITATK